MVFKGNGELYSTSVGVTHEKGKQRSNQCESRSPAPKHLPPAAEVPLIGDSRFLISREKHYKA